MNIFPDNPVFLFSGKDYDKVLDDLGVVRIKIDANLEQKIVDQFHECLVMFDDIDTILPVEVEVTNEKGKSKKVKVSLTDKARNIRDKLLEVGRDIGVSMICLSH